MKRITSIISVLLTIISCNTIILNSQKPVSAPKIDGNIAEWESVIIIPERQSFGFGAMNDESNLYLAMTTYDKQVIMKILRGFTIWIDEKDKNNKDFGIKYPLQQDVQTMMGIEGGMRGGGMGRLDNDQMEFMITSMLSKQNNIIIVDQGLERFAETDNGDTGIQAKLLYNEGDFTYELKIPFNYLDLVANGRYSVGLESIQVDMPGMGGQGKGSGMSGGGMRSGRPGGGMSGGMRGGGMAGGMGKMQEMMNPISFWVTIQLME